MRQIIILLCFMFPVIGFSQQRSVIQDENLVPKYNLPEILKSDKAGKIKNADQWEKIRRPELLKIFQEQVYGRVPGEMKISEVIVREDNGEAFGGLAIRKQVDLVFRNGGKELSIALLMYLPKAVGPVPVFLGCNFMGNHAIAEDVEIRISQSWSLNYPYVGITNNQFTEQSRGAESERWPVKCIIENGFGVATIYCGDVDPDRNDFTDGIHPLFYEEGQSTPAPDEWGTVAAWAWGLSRVVDYLESDDQVDSRKVIAIGHSRLGKAAIWAAASDERFAACISNNSGCMGAALSRRVFGETVAIINNNFPHWFNENFKEYSDVEDKLPVDQHMLLALIAPRPLYVASATEDLWADPKGEFLSAKHAGSVYDLYGLKGLSVETMPVPDTPVIGTVSYHIRTGKHNITLYDWEQYIYFAKGHLLVSKN